MMNRTRGSVVLKFLIVGLLAVTIVGAVSFSQSGTILKGQFTLPFQAHWGKLNLQPGTYSFAVKAENSTYLVSVQQGGHPIGLVLTSVYDSTQRQDHALLCVRHDGACSVGALKMPEGVFYFALPGGKTQVAQQPDLIERVPILFAQK
jgi:hypothetical protein